MDKVYKTLKEAESFFKDKFEYLSKGSRRIVFLKNNKTVIKVPFNKEGIDNNYIEAFKFKKYGKNADIIPYAECWLTYYKNIPVLEMEYVKPILKWKDLPNWAYSIDCCQVGYDKNNILVAYDFG